MKLKLDGKQKYRLRRFMTTTMDKNEYRRIDASNILMLRNWLQGHVQ